MSYREKIAWWSLAAMLLCYIPYFTLVATGVFPGRELPDLQELLVFGITATGHALILGLGYLWCRRQSPAEVKAPMDERDRAIEYRGTRAGLFCADGGHHTGWLRNAFYRKWLESGEYCLVDDYSGGGGA